MKLNKKEKNYLLSTLFKGYVIQCAICSVLILGGTFLLGIMAEEILRKYVLYYYLYYRTEYLYIVAVAIVFIMFALNHPEKSFPWNNTITWLLYGVYFLVAVVLLIAPKIKK